MYKLLSLAASLTFWRSKYCLAEFEECARHRASAEGRAVPDRLMPNGKLIKIPAKR